MMKTIALSALTLSSMATIGYLVYYDQKRRNDPEFRRKLKKQRSAAAKMQKKKEEMAKKDFESSMNSLLEIIAKEPLPSGPSEFEAYFLEHLGQGEMLSKSGENKYMEAAGHFYRALRVYPEPSAILGPLKQTAPAPVFEIVISMMSMEMKKRSDSGLDLSSIE